jgi:hypothetical protein
MYKCCTNTTQKDENGILLSYKKIARAITTEKQIEMLFGLNLISPN